MAMGKSTQIILKIGGDLLDQLLLESKPFYCKAQIDLPAIRLLSRLLDFKGGPRVKKLSSEKKMRFSILSSPNENRNFLHRIQFRVKTKFLFLFQIHLSFECIEPEMEVEIHQRCSTAF